MKIVPVIKSSDLQRSLRFYTEVLDFGASGLVMKTAKWPMESLTWFGTGLNYNFHVIWETESSVPSTAYLWTTSMNVT